MKEKIAPIFIIMIIVVLVILYAGTVLIVLLGMGPLMTAVGIIFALAGTGVSVALLVTLKKRLKEIKEDSENDYSKY
jgi:membrane associated rhomboid family serine protease